jgi:hypothetical protein
MGFSLLNFNHFSLESKRNGSGALNRIFAKSGWFGFNRKLRSRGTIEDGTNRMAAAPDLTQLVPDSRVAMEGLGAFHPSGNSDTFSVCTSTDRWIFISITMNPWEVLRCWPGLPERTTR